MPYVLCPICGNTGHLSVLDQEAWYRDRYPGVPFGTLVAGRCIDCWTDLATGEAVVTRDTLRHRPVSAGQRGIVTAVWTTAEGAVYEVKLASGSTESFVRAQLRRPRDSER